MNDYVSLTYSLFLMSSIRIKMDTIEAVVLIQYFTLINYCTKKVFDYLIYFYLNNKIFNKVISVPLEHDRSGRSFLIER